MSIQALRHHAMAVAADIVRQSPCDALASRASVVGRDYTQALPAGLLNKFWSSPSHKSGRDRSGRCNEYPEGRWQGYYEHFGSGQGRGDSSKEQGAQC